MSKHKNIKSLLRKLTTLTVYHAEKIISTEHQLEKEIVPLLKNSSTKSEIYKEILAKAKELNILATASVIRNLQRASKSNHSNVILLRLERNYDAKQN